MMTAAHRGDHVTLRAPMDGAVRLCVPQRQWTRSGSKRWMPGNASIQFAPWQLVTTSVHCRTTQYTGPELALLAPAGDRERSADLSSDLATKPSVNQES